MKPKDTLNDSVNSDLSDFQINDEYLEENSVTPPPQEYPTQFVNKQFEFLDDEQQLGNTSTQTEENAAKLARQKKLASQKLIIELKSYLHNQLENNPFLKTLKPDLTNLDEVLNAIRPSLEFNAKELVNASLKSDVFSDAEKQDIAEKIVLEVEKDIADDPLRRLERDNLILNATFDLETDNINLKQNTSSDSDNHSAATLTEISNGNEANQTLNQPRTEKKQKKVTFLEVENGIPNSVSSFRSDSINSESTQTTQEIKNSNLFLAFLRCIAKLFCCCCVPSKRRSNNRQGFFNEPESTERSPLIRDSSQASNSYSTLSSLKALR